jgi:hypothetical protein
MSRVSCEWPIFGGPSPSRSVRLPAKSGALERSLAMIRIEGEMVL